MWILRLEKRQMRTKIFLIFISISSYIYAFSFLEFNYILYLRFKYYFSNDVEKFIFFALFLYLRVFVFLAFFIKRSLNE